MGRPPPTPNRKNEPNIDYPNETASMLKARTPVSKKSHVGYQRDVSLVPNYRILSQGLGDTERTSPKRNKAILKTKRRVLLRPAEEDSLYFLNKKEDDLEVEHQIEVPIPCPSQTILFAIGTDTEGRFTGCPLSLNLRILRPYHRFFSLERTSPKTSLNS